MGSGEVCLTPRPRIGFLYNHDQIHQVAHSLPIALNLIERGEAEVSLIVTNPKVAEAVRSMAGTALGQARLIEVAPRTALARGAARLLDRLVPVRKLAIYREQLDLFRQFDALVVSEKSSLLLKTRYGLDRLKLVHTRHGAGDRAIGFSPDSALFDLVLVSGAKIRDRLVAEAGVAPDRIAVVGYCKFDGVGQNKPDLPILGNRRPTVLYNPHPSPRLSSWFRWGTTIIEQFAAQDRYNLIFAPHVMLFARPWTITIDPPAIARNRLPDPAFQDLPHLMIDPGSGASVDMTYTRAADLYLGDVSSQVYEFLTRPRPCLFLNPHKVDWANDPNYRYWHAGPVIDRVDGLITAVDAAFASFPDYLSVQQALLDETFSVTEVPAARRGAEAILAMLERQHQGA